MAVPASCSGSAIIRTSQHNEKTLIRAELSLISCQDARICHPKLPTLVTQVIRKLSRERGRGSCLISPDDFSFSHDWVSEEGKSLSHTFPRGDPALPLSFCNRADTGTDGPGWKIKQRATPSHPCITHPKPPCVIRGLEKAKRHTHWVKWPNQLERRAGYDMII